MHTGDLAVMRDDGYANISGRLKDMIIRGGENIYPREIEEFLYTHPKVAKCRSSACPTRSTARKSAPGSSCTRADRRPPKRSAEFCRGQIATYKIPRYVRFTAEFPMTVTGKIQKFRMREISIAELGLEPLE